MTNNMRCVIVYINEADKLCHRLISSDQKAEALKELIELGFSFAILSSETAITTSHSHDR